MARRIRGPVESQAERRQRAAREALLTDVEYVDGTLRSIKNALKLGRLQPFYLEQLHDQAKQLMWSTEDALLAHGWRLPDEAVVGWPDEQEKTRGGREGWDPERMPTPIRDWVVRTWRSLKKNGVHWDLHHKNYVVSAPLRDTNEKEQ